MLRKQAQKGLHQQRNQTTSKGLLEHHPLPLMAPSCHSPSQHPQSPCTSPVAPTQERTDTTFVTLGRWAGVQGTGCNSRGHPRK